MLTNVITKTLLLSTITNYCAYTLITRYKAGKLCKLQKTETQRIDHGGLCCNRD